MKTLTSLFLISVTLTLQACEGVVADVQVAAPPIDEPLATDSSAIRGATQAAGARPEYVYIQPQARLNPSAPLTSVKLCGGVLIAPRVVLTTTACAAPGQDVNIVGSAGMASSGYQTGPYQRSIEVHVFDAAHGIAAVILPQPLYRDAVAIEYPRLATTGLTAGASLDVVTAVGDVPEGTCSCRTLPPRVYGAAQCRARCLATATGCGPGEAEGLLTLVPNYGTGSGVDRLRLKPVAIRSVGPAAGPFSYELGPDPVTGQTLLVQAHSYTDDFVVCSQYPYRGSVSPPATDFGSPVFVSGTNILAGISWGVSGQGSLIARTDLLHDWLEHEILATQPSLPAMTYSASSHLASVSVRGSGSDYLGANLATFFVRGAGQKHVVVRALGPSLAVASRLANPRIEVRNARGAIVASNDDWQSSTDAAAIAASGHAPPSPLEAAVVMDLDEGMYKAVVREGGTSTPAPLTATSQIEVFGAELATDPRRVAAVQTMGIVLSGEKAISASFVIEGTQPVKVFMRALGPSRGIPNNGVPGNGYSGPDVIPPIYVQLHPALELRSANGTLLSSNNGWPQYGAVHDDIVATGLAPTDRAESALLGTLAPGSYTVTLTNGDMAAYVGGVGSITGFGWLELYELGTVTSPPPPPPATVYSATSHLTNLSTRLFVGTGNQVGITGFIIDGPRGTTKRVTLRVLGPSLGALGIAAPLANPTLELRDGAGAVVASNDDWQTDVNAAQAKTDSAARVQAMGRAPSNPLEPALSVDLLPGAYSAIVRGSNGQTGIALIEAFDEETTSVGPRRLINLSTRGQVMQGDKVMIAGFIVQGTTPLKVLLRGLSNALLPYFSFNELMHQPMLELHDSTGAVVATNNGWSSSANHADIVATGLAPTSVYESALLMNLAPGAYTVVLKTGAYIPQPVDNGIGLVEVYEIGHP